MADTTSVAVQLQKILDEYSDEVRSVTERAMENTAREAAAKLRSTSPRQSRGKHPGRYARGWSVKRVSGLTAVVYNRTDYQLTHLLENGHRIVNQFGEFGRARAIKHIKPVEVWAQSEFPIRVSRGLK